MTYQLNLDLAPPAIGWSVFFAVLYLAQMVRLGRLSMHGKNPFARPLMNFWCVVAYAPLIIIALNPKEVEPLAAVIVWVREYILFLLAGIVVLGQVMIIRSRQAHISKLLTALKETEDAARRFDMAQRLQWYGCVDAAIRAHQRTIDTAAKGETSREYVAKSCINLASLVGPRGDFARAESLCRQAILIDPNNGQAFFYLAMALFEQGRRAEARNAAQKCRELGVPNRYQPSLERLLIRCKRD